jgi:hypothetical protein
MRPAGAPGLSGHRRHDATAGLVQVRAVVELALRHVRLQVGHQGRSCMLSIWLRPNSWKPGESISAVVRSASTQYKVGRRRGVLARVERLRDLAGEHLRLRHQQVDQRALAGPEGPEHQRGLAPQVAQQVLAIGVLGLRSDSGSTP